MCGPAIISTQGMHFQIIVIISTTFYQRDRCFAAIINCLKRLERHEQSYKKKTYLSN